MRIEEKAAVEVGKLTDNFVSLRRLEEEFSLLVGSLGLEGVHEHGLVESEGGGHV